MVVALCFGCYGSLLGFVSDECSFVVAFVHVLFISGYIFYVSMYIQDEYRRLYVLLLVLLFTVNVISSLLLRDVLLRLQVAEDFFVSFRQTACIYNYGFS